PTLPPSGNHHERRRPKPQPQLPPPHVQPRPWQVRRRAPDPGVHPAHTLRTDVPRRRAADLERDTGPPGILGPCPGGRLLRVGGLSDARPARPSPAVADAAAGPV